MRLLVTVYLYTTFLAKPEVNFSIKILYSKFSRKWTKLSSIDVVFHFMHFSPFMLSFNVVRTDKPRFHLVKPDIHAPISSICNRESATRLSLSSQAAQNGTLSNLRAFTVIRSEAICARHDAAAAFGDTGKRWLNHVRWMGDMAKGKLDGIRWVRKPHRKTCLTHPVYDHPVHTREKLTFHMIK